jgi:DNA-directed RNA polymerase
MQHYLNSTSIRLKPFSFRKNSFVIVKATDSINQRKQVRALMPNLIHSLDSSSLALLVNLYFNDSTDQNKINNFYSIHDCFAVTANNVGTLINLLQLVYIKIYCEEQYLRKFHEGILHTIKLQYGEECFNKEKNEITIYSNDDRKTSNIVLKFPNIDEVLKGTIASVDIAKAGYIVN